MSKKKARIDTLVKLLESNYKVVVLDEHVQSGIFPWHNGKTGMIYSFTFFSHKKLSLILSGSVSADYDLMENWNLMLRYQEAIELNKKEMAMFLSSCRRTIVSLSNDMKKREEERIESNDLPTLLKRSYDVAQATEKQRLLKVVNEAEDLFRQIQGGLRSIEEDCLDQVERGGTEEILLVEEDYDSTEDLEMVELIDEADDCCDWLNG